MKLFTSNNSRNGREPNIRRWQTIVASLYLVLMCTQYWPVEGVGTSLVKVPLMCLSPLILFFAWRYGVQWKVIFCAAACVGWKLTVGYFQTASFRVETLVYSIVFFLTYIMFYTLVHNGCFTLEKARTLLEALMWAYIIVLIIQQIYSLSGGGEWQLMNLNFARKHVLKCQSLSLEPSHSGRILGAMFYALLKIWEFQMGKRLSIGDLWSEHRWLTAGFLYSMISMQSAAAIFVLLLLMLYFFHWKYIIPLIMFFVFLPEIAEFSDSNELRRVLDTIESSATGDVDEVIKADNSASFRIAPILNMLHVDYSDVNLWTGRGIDSAYNVLQASIMKSRYELLPGEILDIGIIGYALSLILVFCCAIRPIASLPTLMFFCGVGGWTNNVAYGWGILMIFTVISYFYEQKQKNSNYKDAQ